MILFCVNDAIVLHLNLKLAGLSSKFDLEAGLEQLWSINTLSSLCFAATNLPMLKMRPREPIRPAKKVLQPDVIGEEHRWRIGDCIDTPGEQQQARVYKAADISSAIVCKKPEEETYRKNDNIFM